MSGTAMFNTIALDVAQRIINREFEVGTKISGRSLLASHYNVSPETIRKAISLLKDANIVSVSQGKEILVISVEQARLFVAHNKDMKSVYSLKQDLEILLAQKQELDQRFEQLLGEIINQSDRLKNLTPYNPVEVKIPPESSIVGKSLITLNLWQQTGATVIAIRRGTKIIVSPDPSFALAAADSIVVVGQDDVSQKLTAFINKNITETNDDLHHLVE